MNKCHTQTVFMLIVNTFFLFLIEMKHFRVIYIWMNLKRKLLIIHTIELPLYVQYALILNGNK